MSDFTNLQVKTGSKVLATAKKATGIKNDTVVELHDVTWSDSSFPPKFLQSKLTVSGTRADGASFQSDMTLDAAGGDWKDGTGFLTFSNL